MYQATVFKFVCPEKVFGKGGSVKDVLTDVYIHFSVIFFLIPNNLFGSLLSLFHSCIIVHSN